MSRSNIYPPEVFVVRVAQKKPALKAIIDTLESYSDDDLLAMTSQPLWAREALVKLKKINAEAEGLLLASDRILNDSTFGVNPDPQCEVRVWNSGTQFVKSIGADYEFNTGDLILLDSTNLEVHLGHTRIRMTPEGWTKVIASSTLKDTKNVLEYRDLCKEELQKKHG